MTVGKLVSLEYVSQNSPKSCHSLSVTGVNTCLACWLVTLDTSTNGYLVRVHNFVQDQAEQDVWPDNYILSCIYLSNHLRAMSVCEAFPEECDTARHLLTAEENTATLHAIHLLL